MNVEYHKWWSRSLGQEMELKVYGHAGRPFIVFPTSSGRFYDFEDNGMVNAAERFIREGKIKLFCVDSIDPQSWDNTQKQPEEKARRHNDYDGYIISEVVPFIKTHCAGDVGIMCTGVSMGASHSALFFFKHPDIFNGAIALSGVYNFRFFLNGYDGDSLDVYYNSPLDFLPDLKDEWYLEKYRKSSIIICVGQGAWEGPMIADTAKIKEILKAKNIPCTIDFWGHDVNHDWPWWRVQFPYFLEKLYG
ncbi:MAG: transposase [Nitrospirae bacterium]|nr:MAG: transposase [Nitrospirota bacterium]